MDRCSIKTYHVYFQKPSSNLSFTACVLLSIGIVALSSIAGGGITIVLILDWLSTPVYDEVIGVCNGSSSFFSVVSSLESLLLLLLSRILTDSFFSSTEPVVCSEDIETVERIDLKPPIGSLSPLSASFSVLLLLMMLPGFCFPSISSWACSSVSRLSSCLSSR